jgi:WD40 repeat protein
MKDESTERERRADEEVRRNLPPGVTLVRTLRGHKGEIGRIAWSPDGGILASPSKDNTIRLWDAETGECRRILKGHQEYVLSVAFAPTGKILASGGGDQEKNADCGVRLWDIASGELLNRFGKHLSSISCLAFDPSGERLASGSFDTAVRLWEIPSGYQAGIVGSPRSLEPGTDAVFDVAYDRTGQHLVIGSEKSGLRFLKTTNREVVLSLKGHGWSTNFAFDRTGEMLASGGGRQDSEALGCGQSATAPDLGRSYSNGGLS